MSPAKSFKASLSVGPVRPEWDPNSKEPWHLELEKEPVNDNKWNCIVTAAVPSEAEYQEYIQQYHQYISQGLRKAIKTITMDDVIKLLKKPDNGSKRNTKNSKNKKEIIKKSETTIKPPSDSPFSQIIDLASKYAVIIDNDCKLPPDLMAGVLKYLILKLKKESRLEKKRTILREKKLRQLNLRAKFIRDLVLFKTKEKEIPGEAKSSDESISNEDVVQDEPTDGPDLYIMLIDFYDYAIFLELRRLGVLFLAILDISVLGKARTIKETITPAPKTDTKKQLILSFWEKHNSEIKDGEKTFSYKDIITIRYIKKIKPYESAPKLFRCLSTELTWTQYSVYVIYRQHQKYLQELYVQRMIVSLEPLSLSKCVIYNKICDAFVKGGTLTTLLVLYAIIEQVVAGVPETDSVAYEYETQPSDFFYDESDDLDESKKVMMVTPCLPCRNKKAENICEKLKKNAVKIESLERGGWSSTAEEHNELSLSSQNQNTEDETTIFSPEYLIPESYLDQALSEKETEKDFRNKKKWEAPVICFYGDSISVETSYFKPRLFNAEVIVDRFFKNTNLGQIWDDYPRLPPENRAFYNFHLQLLQKISQKNEEMLKLQLHFSVLMKMIGIATSFLYRGDEETLSEPEEGATMLRFSTVQFEKGTNDADTSDFSSYFIRKFVRDEIRIPKPPILKIVSGDVKGSYLGTNKQIQKKAQTRSLGLLSHTLSQTSYFQTVVSVSKSSSEESSSTTKGERNEAFTLSALLDCYEISNLTQPNFIIKKEDFMSMVENFKFYERFEPHIMLQRLQEAQNDFNTTHISYFPLTDTFFIIMYDDYDHRGLSYSKNNRILPTPIYFRDFYTYFYEILAVWLIKEVDEQKKFVQELQNKAKAEAEVSDSLYLSQLNECYLKLSEEDKQRFLETDLENLEIDINDEELEELPVKPKPKRPDKVSFVVTNYKDLWVEFTRKMHEFKALDGTEINVKVESWLYTPSNVLRLRVKLLRFELYYNQSLEEEKIQTSFTFRTKSGIIFSFYKPEQEEEEEEETEQPEEKRYHVTISWPTGLIIQPLTLTTSYIKQSYLKIYRKDWDIKEEASRCFVKNGQVIIFNEYGGYEILCPSGTKYTFSNAKQKYEIITTTGELWEVHVGRCKNKKTLLGNMKVFIGEDKKAEEIFYKREDGVYCLLWTNGKLVTSYPDGTKITTTPDFDENEITVEWTDEEKLWLKELRLNSKSEQSIEKNTNRSSIKHKISYSDRKSYENNFEENFVSISCSYLIEHPKYSTVYYNSEEDNIRLTMPENINMYINPGGEYIIRRENTFLKVCGTIIEACKECPECRVKTTVDLFLHENEILCKCVDVNSNLFLLYRNGKTTYEENDEVSEGKPKISTIKHCIAHHNKSEILKQRCFALERDLSGVEFLHADSIAMYADQLSEDTFYDINTEDPSNMCHTFTCPYYKVGSEKWIMKYETENDSLPTNLKKKDLKELGVKEVVKNFFKYPFPGKKGCGEEQQESKAPKENVKMPKLVIARTIWAWPKDPYTIIEEFKEDIEHYQEEGRFIRNRYRSRPAKSEQSYDARYIMMRLRKIALTLNQSLHMYPHLCTQYPSTEKEIHYFGHFINTMGDMKSHFKDVDIIPDCKQIPIPLPRKADFPPIPEESGSPRSD